MEIKAWHMRGLMVWGAALVLSLALAGTALATEMVRVGLIGSYTSDFVKDATHVRYAKDAWLELRTGHVAIEVILKDDGSRPEEARSAAEWLVHRHKVGAVIGPFSQPMSKAAAGVLSDAKVPFLALVPIDEQVRNDLILSMPVPYGTLETAAVGFIRERLKPRSLDVAAFHEVYVDGESGWRRTLPETRIRSIILSPNQSIPEQLHHEGGVLFLDTPSGLLHLERVMGDRSSKTQKVVSLWGGGQDTVDNLPPDVYLVSFARPSGGDALAFASHFERLAQRKPNSQEYFVAAALDLFNEAALRLGTHNSDRLFRTIGQGNLETMLGTIRVIGDGYLSIVLPIVILESRDGRLNTIMSTGGGTRDCLSQSNCGQGCCEKVNKNCPSKTCTDG